MKKENDEEIYYGPVYIKSGKYKGMIGNYDDDEVDEKGRDCAVVYIGINLMYSDYVFIPHKHLSNVTTENLIKRQKIIFEKTFEYHNLARKSRGFKEHEQQVQLLNELLLTETILHEKFISARFLNKNSGKKIFISHSSIDKAFARMIATDLTSAGHIPWLDEWNIRIGESIPSSIGRALRNSDYILVILSENSNSSHWVQAEWEAKYWDEISEGNVKVLPILYETCNIPELLKTKKYADFTTDYKNAFDDLLLSIV